MDDWRYLEELQEIIFDYNSINKFISTYKKIDFIRFDYYTSQKVSLFLVHENIDFNVISSTVDFISKYLKSIICIFEKPIIQLKEIEDILPIEMVHKINNDTFNYATIHSELLENYTQKGIKPRKLLTRTYDNNFSIYENQIFAQTIDDIFCGDKLKKTKEEGKAAYVCSTCRTKIEKIKCSKCNKYFFATSIDKFLIDEDKCLNNTFGKVDYSKLLFYRNITKINEFGEPICPHCDKDL